MRSAGREEIEVRIVVLRTVGMGVAMYAILCLDHLRQVRRNGEERNRAVHVLRLLIERHRCRRCFLGKGRILLRHLVHAGDRLVDLIDAGRLFRAGRRNLGDDIPNLFHADDDFTERLPRLVDQLSTGVHFSDAVADQVLDLLGGIRRSGCKVAYLGGYNGEPASLLTRAGRFDRGIERKQVGLKRDFVDYADDLSDLVR